MSVGLSQQISWLFQGGFQSRSQVPDFSLMHADQGTVLSFPFPDSSPGGFLWSTEGRQKSIHDDVAGGDVHTVIPQSTFLSQSAETHWPPSPPSTPLFKARFLPLLDLLLQCQPKQWSQVHLLLLLPPALCSPFFWILHFHALRTVSAPEMLFFIAPVFKTFPGDAIAVDWTL